MQVLTALFDQAHNLFFVLPKQDATSWWISTLFGGIGVGMVGAVLTALLGALRAACRLVGVLVSIVSGRTQKNSHLPNVRTAAESSPEEPRRPFELIKPSIDEISKVERSRDIIPRDYLSDGGTSGHDHEHMRGINCTTRSYRYADDSRQYVERRRSLSILIFVLPIAFLIWMLIGRG